MGISLDPVQLQYQMDIRALGGKDLARIAGVSGSTVSNARAGKRIWPKSFDRIAAALASIPVDELRARLLKPPGKASTDDQPPAPPDGEP